MSQAEVLILDYGAGNIKSVANAIHTLGYSPRLSDSPADLRTARIVVFPGQGAAAQAMSSLRGKGLVEEIKEYIGRDKPFFGVCLGLQVLFTISEEDGDCPCLDLIPGKVKLLPPGLKTPHMGWNQVRQMQNHPVFNGVPDNTNFYFVHSYHAVPKDRSIVIGEADYGIAVCSAIAKGRLVATQFHPEKSGVPGLKLYDNFIKLALQ